MLKIVEVEKLYKRDQRRKIIYLKWKENILNLEDCFEIDTE